MQSGTALRSSPLSLSTFAAGFITVLVGVTSSVILIFQAAQSAGADARAISSWIGAFGLGLALTCIGLSAWLRAPVVTAWSTPGAALLIMSLHGVPMNQAIGAFMFSAALMFLCGITGWFERVINRIPMPLAGAMLAGVLVHFGMDVFVAMRSQFALVAAMFATYLVGYRFIPRYAVIAVLTMGILIAGQAGLLHTQDVHMAFATPVFTMPAFSWSACLGVGVPLFIVTMASQNLPGVAVMRTSGYNLPVSPLITWTGLATLVLAPFGCFALNLAAITAAICQGENAHPDPRQRYWAAIYAGVFYLLVGIFGATVAELFTVFPKELVTALAGIALFGTIGNGLSTAMKADDTREAALVTFLVTASGVSAWGVGSAFWGVAAGAITALVFSGRGKRKA
jgi:benzoate membrane transport protein